MRSRIVQCAIGGAAAALITIVAVVVVRKYMLYSAPDDATLQELGMLARVLEPKEFDIARIEDGTLTTFLARARGGLVEYDPKERLPLEPIIGRQALRRHIYGIAKQGPMIRFTLGGAVDDEWGVLYAPRGTLKLGDVANLSIIAGHPEWFEFDTMMKSR